MSFFSDLFEGKTSNLGNDISGMFRPNELAQTLEGTAAVAAPFAIGALAPAVGGALGFGGAEAAGGALPFAAEGGAAAGDAGGAITDLIGSGGGGGNVLSFADAAGGGGDVAGGTAIGSPIIGTPPSVGYQVPAGGGSFIDSLVKGVEGLPGAIGNQITKNPLGVLVGGGALAYNMLQGQKKLPEQNQLQGQANQLSAQGQQFMSYLQTGTLPAGLQAAVDRATQAAKAQIIANAARNGLSTDPTQNSALAQDLASADRNALIAVAQEGESLFKSGADEVQLSSQILDKLMQIDQQQTANMGKAIANFAGALSGPMRMAA
jgi:hypothetical protein